MQAALNPLPQRSGGAVAQRTNVNEAFHRPSGEIHRARVGPRKRLVVRVVAHADYKICADDAAAPVAINHERESAEHSPFLGWAFVRQDVADSLGYAFIEGHRLLIRSCRRSAATAAPRCYRLQPNGFSSALGP